MWTLIVVALVGLAGTYALEIDATISQREREKELLFIGHQFRMALQRYREATPANGRPYPASLEELLDDRRSGMAHRHLRKIFVDPMTKKALWGMVWLDGRIVGIYSLSAQAPVKRDGFEQDDAAFKNASHYSDWKFLVSPEMQTGAKR
ncbi:type II secretion system protein [Pseudoduganella ginsengisoli]|uniref:Type II secretion system protein n=1 Tax=Pseudoduganella ginsengisoli TaxID=1462440 RepID=A0A6L6PZ50_9BURK|nr:type II secretion system protein [Pseudoduganella ginsengisoli]MTW02434.1 type II secretion system protein [Pseudoduganella ginsengisoli]